MKKIILGLILLLSIGVTYGQDLPVSGFAKKKKADKAKKAVKRNERLKGAIPLFGFVASRLSITTPNEPLFFTPVISHSNLLKDFRPRLYIQNFGLEANPIPIIILRSPITR